MKLYYAPGACSLAPHIVSREAGLTLELDKLDFATRITEGGEAFSDVNPKGYVPALRLDDGSVLTEVATLVQYLADQPPNRAFPRRTGRSSAIVSRSGSPSSRPRSTRVSARCGTPPFPTRPRTPLGPTLPSASRTWTVS